MGKLGEWVLVAGICSTTLLALVSGSSATPAAEPIPITLFAHGSSIVGEAQVPGAISGTYMEMDRTPPTAELPRSIGLVNAGAASPDPRCSGSPYFPVWVGEVGGHIEGEVVFEFHVVSSPGGKVRVRVWPDIDRWGCEEEYREPVAATVVDLPEGSGEVRALMHGVDFETANNVMVQVTPQLERTGQGRVLYDARTSATSLSFSCTPLWGTTCGPYRD